MTYNDLTPSDWTAISAAIIALISLFATIYQARILREHNILSTKPLINFVSYIGIDDIMHITIHNHGLGPAIINEVIICYKDSTYNHNNEEEAYSLTKKLSIDGQNFFSTAIILKQTPIPPNGSIPIIKTESPAKSSMEIVQFNHIANLLKDIEIKIKYQSMYGEKFNEKFKITSPTDEVHIIPNA
jgi:hypothetical protein